MNKLEAAIKMLECYSYANDTPFHTKTIGAVIELLIDFDNEEYKTSPRAIDNFQPNTLGLISQIFNQGEK